MSTTSYWRIMPPVEPNHLDDSAREIISKRLCGDKYLSGKPILNCTHLEWLRGVRDAGVEGLDEIIAAIESGENIQVWCEH